jgi:crotonobetainyl-CoA:carnitine CoA-transferase CaiB-like acyl-CoA transferase
MPALPGMDLDALRPAPRLGEHSIEILTEAGYDRAHIDALVGAGVVGVG